MSNFVVLRRGVDPDLLQHAYREGGTQAVWRLLDLPGTPPALESGELDTEALGGLTTNGLLLGRTYRRSAPRRRPRRAPTSAPAPEGSAESCPEEPQAVEPTPEAQEPVATLVGRQRGIWRAVRRLRKPRTATPTQPD